MTVEIRVELVRPSPDKSQVVGTEEYTNLTGDVELAVAPFVGMAIQFGLAEPDPVGGSGGFSSPMQTGAAEGIFEVDQVAYEVEHQSVWIWGGFDWDSDMPEERFERLVGRLVTDYGFLRWPQGDDEWLSLSRRWVADRRRQEHDGPRAGSRLYKRLSGEHALLSVVVCLDLVSGSGESETHVLLDKGIEMAVEPLPGMEIQLGDSVDPGQKERYHALLKATSERASSLLTVERVVYELDRHRIIAQVDAGDARCLTQGDLNLLAEQYTLAYGFHRRGA